ncbi:hypothetical protein BCAR13_440127 [Paraburkholderia caribensis]|nr:hypothetical protein BCAR13_440127 [Paraburkholderia caribensis]
MTGHERFHYKVVICWRCIDSMEALAVRWGVLVMNMQRHWTRDVSYRTRQWIKDNEFVMELTVLCKR